MTTARDIADKLQISASTVGRALADDPRISPATKQRVEQAAAELGYVVNRAARMMRGASSNLVGLVVPDIRNSFYSTTAHALSKCLEQGGYQLTLSETDDDRDTELRHVRELSSASVAGIIIVPSAKPHPDAVRLLAALPHIQLLRQNPALADRWFGIDDTQALAQATQHLVQAGHRRIAYIGGAPELPTGEARRRGFRAALAGTPAAAQAIEETGSPSAADFGRDALRRLLDRSSAPTAIVTGSVRITEGVLDEIIDRGVRVPEQLSVVGFGDEPGFRWWGPGLTTLALPVSDLATACGLWFMHQMMRKPPNLSGYRSISPASLLVRGSTRAIGAAAKAGSPARGATAS